MACPFFHNRKHWHSHNRKCVINNHNERRISNYPLSVTQYSFLFPTVFLPVVIFFFFLLLSTIISWVHVVFAPKHLQYKNENIMLMCLNPFRAWRWPLHLALLRCSLDARREKKEEPQFWEATIRANDHLTDGSLHFFDAIISRNLTWRMNAPKIPLCDCKGE